MVEIQNNVDFWTSDYLEISFLAGEQPLVLWMERTIAVSFPSVLLCCQMLGGSASQAFTYSNRCLNNSSNRKELTTLMGVLVAMW